MVLAQLLVLVPLAVAAVLAAAAPLGIGRAGGIVALLATLALAGLAATLLGRLDGTQVTWLGGWHPRGGVAVGIALAPDGLGTAFAVYVAALGVVTATTAAWVIDDASPHFHALGLVLLAAMAGFAVTADLFDLFVLFELMSVAAYVLVSYEVGERAPLQGSLAFALSNSVGSVLLLFGIGLVYGRTGALDLAQIGRALAGERPDALVLVAYALIATGFLVKAAIVPFHAWVADAYAAAPTPICVLLAGAFSEVGLLGLARVHWTAFAPALAGHEDVVRAVLVAAGALTAVFGAVLCALQVHLKRLLAFATIAQSGLFLLALGLLSEAGVAGAAVWIVADGLVKASLFVVVAVLEHRFDVVDEGGLHGRGAGLRPLGLVFALGALAIASLPPTGSFLARSLVEDAALEQPGYGWVPPLMAAVTAVLGGTLLRVGGRVFLGLGRPADRPPRGAGRDDDTDEEREHSRAGRGVLWGASVVLVLASVCWGVVPGLVEAAARAAAGFVDTTGYAGAVLDGRPPAPRVEALAHPGATAYLWSVVSLAGALAVGAVGLRGPLQRSEGVPQRVADALHAVHDGRPTSYLTYVALGAALLTGVLLVGIG